MLSLLIYIIIDKILKGLYLGCKRVQKMFRQGSRPFYLFLIIFIIGRSIVGPETDDQTLKLLSTYLVIDKKVIFKY